MRVYKGSVKNFFVEKEPTQNSFGKGFFEFTDDYSIFDFGKMPDVIPFKGEALARMSAFNFLELEKLGIKTHFKEFVPPNRINVSIVRVLFPQKNEISKGEKNYLVPLEIIFRNSLPAGSSVFKRLEKGEITPKDLGLNHVPMQGELLEKPLLDVSTKLEETDRYLSWKQAQELAVIDSQMLEKIKKWALKINSFISSKARSIGLEHADGKVEMAISPTGELVMVDVCGTLDENRLLFDGLHLSKQVLRDYYKKTQWFNLLEKAKSQNLPKEQWPKPPKAPKQLIKIVSNMYKSVCEAWTNQKTWNAPSIQQIVQEYKKFLQEKNK